MRQKRSRAGRVLGAAVPADPGAPVTLKALADHLGLSPATISLVVNRAPAVRAIPRATQERALAAARKFNYRANTIARSLRAQRSFTLGVLVPEIVLERISNSNKTVHPRQITVQPELVVRGSTAAAPPGRAR